MQVTIGAQCWDGVRRKSLLEKVKVVEIAAQEQQPKAVRMDPKLKALMSFGIPLASLVPTRVFAAPEAVPAIAVPGAVKERILHAFDPLIDLALALSYPIAGVMIAGGCLFIMIGNRERGMQMLQNAAIGYILVQLSPMFLNLLVGVGSTVS